MVLLGRITLITFMGVRRITEAGEMKRLNLVWQGMVSSVIIITAAMAMRYPYQKIETAFGFTLCSVVLDESVEELRPSA